MAQFRKKVDTDAASFKVLQWRPNVRTSGAGLLGEPLHGGRHNQATVDRGFFYVFADKIGTIRDDTGKPCVVGNYAPAWVPDAMYTYVVKGQWAEVLWRQRKLTHTTYEDYLVLCRDGYISRKRTLDAIREAEEDAATSQEIAATTQRIRSNSDVYKRVKEYQVLSDWRSLFADDSPDRLRFPILVVLAPSFCGKTELAMSLFRKPLKVQIGKLQHFPDTMRDFRRGHHDAVVVDDVRDLDFVVQNQEKFQGKYSEPVEFGSSPCGQNAYKRYLYKIPMVVTVNYSTTGLDLLHRDDFLGKEQNRVLFELKESPFMDAEVGVSEAAGAITLPERS